MRICKHCRRDLDRRPHAPLCTIGNTIKAFDQGEGDESIRIAFPNDEAKHIYEEMMTRTVMMLTTVKTFLDQGSELDETAPDFGEQFAPYLEKFLQDMFLIYPSPAFLEADLKTLMGKKVE